MIFLFAFVSNIQGPPANLNGALATGGQPQTPISETPPPPVQAPPAPVTAAPEPMETQS